MRDSGAFLVLTVLVLCFLGAVACVIGISFDLLACGSLQESVGIDTHYDLRNGCRVNDNNVLISVKEWMESK